MTANRPEIGARIKEIRKHKLCWTQEQLAERLGLHKNSVSAYETGKTRPDEDKLEKIAELAGLPYREAFGDCKPIMDFAAFNLLDGVTWQDVGRRIREIREEREWTVTELGEILGMPDREVVALESGERDPAHYRLRNIAEAAGVHPGDMFSDVVRYHFDSGRPMADRFSRKPLDLPDMRLPRLGSTGNQVLLIQAQERLEWARAAAEDAKAARLRAEIIQSHLETATAPGEAGAVPDPGATHTEQIDRALPDEEQDRQTG